MYNILFVCTGNICRSPTAEGVLRHRLALHGLEDKVQVDSAGTHAYHVGEAPDMRSVAAAKKRGILIGDLRARKIAPADFHRFQLILGLDAEHVRLLRLMSPSSSISTVDLFLNYVHGKMQDVPDPYYGDERGFEHVLDLAEAGADAMITKLKIHSIGV